MYFRAETLPESPLSRAYLKAGCQALGSCPLGKMESPLRRLSCRSGLTHLLNWHSCLAFPTEAFPLKDKTQFCFLDSTECKINPSAGKKTKEIACASFADSFCRHLTSIAHLCPAFSCCWKFFAIPISVLEEVVSLLLGDCGHRQQLEKQVTEPHKQHKTGQIQPITSQGPSSYPVPAVRDWPTYTLASSS